ncbi:unnamed protein product [Enterobius vermicularis]|uniref:Gamma-secretase subunit PEN-2 n=1 Tax=Enterobius vermicularis TaxID=51028 RepID=A0A0N4V8W6_ENTVE|nr:unnamed protein product [Enterobius vermicularis]
MDFSRLPEERKAYIVKRYFLIGCACAPLVWAFNVFFFFDYAFRSGTSSQHQKVVRKCGFILFLSLLLSNGLCAVLLSLSSFSNPIFWIDCATFCWRLRIKNVSKLVKKETPKCRTQ